MHCRSVLAVSVLVALLTCNQRATATAACPVGLRSVTGGSELQQAQTVGNGQAAYQIHRVLPCTPYYVQPVFLKAFKTYVTPLCTDGAAVFTYKVVVRDPCSHGGGGGGSGVSIGTMRVDTRPQACDKSWVEVQRNSSSSMAYVAPDWLKLPPMTTCPTGYRHATANEELYIASPLLRSFFLDSEEMAVLMDPSVAGEYCQAFDSVRLSGVDACIEDALQGGQPSIQAHAKIEWVCAGQSAVHSIGLIASGQYALTCKWNTTVTFGSH